jgi:hypothetical protein
MEKVSHEETIFVLYFEKEDCGMIEFYNKNKSIMNWRILLKNQLNMLDYQHFY